MTREVSDVFRAHTAQQEEYELLRRIGFDAESGYTRIEGFHVNLDAVCRRALVSPGAHQIMRGARPEELSEADAATVRTAIILATVDNTLYLDEQQRHLRLAGVEDPVTGGRMPPVQNPPVPRLRRAYLVEVGERLAMLREDQRLKGEFPVGLDHGLHRLGYPSYRELVDFGLVVDTDAEAVDELTFGVMGSFCGYQFEGFDLPPRLSMGVAYVAQALYAMYQFQRCTNVRAMSFDEQVKLLTFFWEEIALRRLLDQRLRSILMLMADPLAATNQRLDHALGKMVGMDLSFVGEQTMLDFMRALDALAEADTEQVILDALHICEDMVRQPIVLTEDLSLESIVSRLDHDVAGARLYAAACAREQDIFKPPHRGQLLEFTGTTPADEKAAGK